jgi:RHS repeat-associated protein
MCTRTRSRAGKHSCWKGRLACSALARRAGPPVNLKALHAKIGELALEDDFLSGALGKGSFTYCYDSESRLAAIIGAGTCAAPTTTVASYAYDAQGWRKSKTVGSTTTMFVTDADNREVLEYDGTSGAVQNWYSFALGPDAVLNRMNVAGNSRETLIPDIQGSVIGALDASTGTLAKIGYQAYGENPTLTSGSYRYTGRRLDAETAGSSAEPSGLYYYRARMFSPAWGRFMQPDPIGYAGGSNLYAYVDNDPLNATDPDGQCPWCIGALIGAGIDIGTQLAINIASGQSIGQSIRNINVAEVALSAALGAVGNIAGGRAASAGLRAASIETKGTIGEIGAAIKGLAEGRIVTNRQVDQALSRGFTRVDQVQTSLFSGEETLVEAKFATNGVPRLSSAQTRALTELPAQGIDYRVVTTSADEVIGAARSAGAAAGGGIGSGVGAAERSYSGAGK